jgi:hypothetical protein
MFKNFVKHLQKKSNPKSFKRKKIIDYPSYPKNKRVVVLIHNSTTIYPIDMRLFAPQTLFFFYMLYKIDMTIKQKLHSQSQDQMSKFTSRTNLVL